MYDIIGDIHGRADTLEKMLWLLGYREKNNVYRHNSRKAIFVGDIIDKGPKIRRSLQIVEAMTRYGSGICILGNHEAKLVYLFANETNDFLDTYNCVKNQIQIKETLKDFEKHLDELKYYIDWMAKLPIYVEMSNIRIIHACWDFSHVKFLKLKNINKLSDKKFLTKAYNKKSSEYKALQTLITGKKINLPPDVYHIDKYNIKLNDIRAKWWKNLDNKKYKDASLINMKNLPDIVIPDEYLTDITGYPENAPPVFFGHYRLKGEIKIQAPNVCCVDYGLGECRNLVAYRFDGEQVLDNSKFVCVKCIDNNNNILS